MFLSNSLWTAVLSYLQPGVYPKLKSIQMVNRSVMNNLALAYLAESNSHTSIATQVHLDDLKRISGSSDILHESLDADWISMVDRPTWKSHYHNPIFLVFGGRCRIGVLSSEDDCFSTVQEEGKWYHAFYCLSKKGEDRPSRRSLMKKAAARSKASMFSGTVEVYNTREFLASGKQTYWPIVDIVLEADVDLKCYSVDINILRVFVKSFTFWSGCLDFLDELRDKFDDTRLQNTIRAKTVTLDRLTSAYGYPDASLEIQATEVVIGWCVFQNTRFQIESDLLTMIDNQFHGDFTGLECISVKCHQFISVKDEFGCNLPLARGTCQKAFIYQAGPCCDSIVFCLLSTDNERCPCLTDEQFNCPVQKGDDQEVAPLFYPQSSSLERFLKDEQLRLPIVEGYDWSDLFEKEVYMWEMDDIRT